MSEVQKQSSSLSSMEVKEALCQVILFLEEQEDKGIESVEAARNIEIGLSGESNFDGHQAEFNTGEFKITINKRISC